MRHVAVHCGILRQKRRNAPHRNAPHPTWTNLNTHKTDVTPATKSRAVTRVKVASVTACRTLRHGASHSRATRFRNRALLYSMRLWLASESRVKYAGQNRRCDIGLTLRFPRAIWVQTIQRRVRISGVEGWTLQWLSWIPQFTFDTVLWGLAGTLPVPFIRGAVKKFWA